MFPNFLILSARQSNSESMDDVFSDDRNTGANRTRFVQLSQGFGGRTRTRTTYYLDMSRRTQRNEM